MTAGQTKAGYLNCRRGGGVEMHCGGFGGIECHWGARLIIRVPDTPHDP
jgi:hypothetical protein